MTVSFITLLLSVLVVVICEVHKGSFETPEGDTISYRIENSGDFAYLLVHRVGDPTHEELVNVTYDKATDKIWFHILGQDHMDSTEDNYEEEAAVTAQLMDTAFGRYLPALSHHVFDTHGVYGHENEAMMLLYQLAMFSHDFHVPSTSERRLKRSWFHLKSSVNEEKEDDVDLSNVFDEEVVDICNNQLLSRHDGCSSNLAVEGSDNTCKKRTDYEAKEARQFTTDEVARGCWGLCGPWCQCWDHICGDCCWHPGCFQHDQYCGKNPNSNSCKFGKGVVYGTSGLHVC